MNFTLKEERITISGATSIGATITYTDKNTLSPAIVVIMGTGKTDREGNEKGFHTDLYKKFAEFFTGLGFICVRYDKRGTYQTAGDFNTTGLHDLMDDAISVIQYVKTLTYVDKTKVLVCGHSEGAMIATLLSEKDRVFFGGAMLNAKWVREHASHSTEDYIMLLKKYGKPILAVTGTADISVDYRSLSALSEIPSVEVSTPSNVNHILREIDDDNSILTVKKQYKRLAAQPMHTATEEKIKEWLSQYIEECYSRLSDEKVTISEEIAEK